MSWTSVSRGRIAVVLAALLALAAWLRLDGIDYGLDFADGDVSLLTNDVDARGMVRQVQTAFREHSLHPGSFLFRGPAAFYVFGAVDAAVVGVRALADPGGWRGAWAELERNPSPLYLTHRIVSAVAGVLTVAFLFRIARRELGPAEGVLAGAILACAYLHVRDSHFGTVDVLSGLTTVAALDRMLLLVRAPRARTYLASGLLAGIAAATKYFGVALGAHLVLAHLLARRAARAAGVPPPGVRLLALGLVACPLGFFLAFPGAPVAFGDLVHHLRYDVSTLSPGLDLAIQWSNLRFHGYYTLLVGLGEPVLVLALAGLVPLWRRDPAGRFLALSSALFVPTLFSAWVHNARYGMLLLVLLVIPAAVLLAAVLRRVPRVLAPLLVLVVLAPSLARGLALNRLFEGLDTRVEMLALLRGRNLPPAEVLAVGRPQDLPVPDEPARAPFVPQSVERRPGPSIAQILARPPRLILWGSDSPPAEIPDHARLAQLVRDDYRELVRLDVRPPGVSWPDERVGTPFLQLRYERPWQQTRPGPGLVLYERVEREGAR